MGYVRVVFGALNVESQCSWAVRAELLKPVEIPQVHFLDKVVFMPVAC